MTLSIKRMSAGDGYRYLMRSVAVGDGARDMSSPLTRYYTESGNPPGRWLGSGLVGLDDGRGLEPGSCASEQQMFQLFGMGNDPVSGEQLGARPYRLDSSTGRGSVAGFDLTFSVPKSVSVWWGLADGPTRQAIHQAHDAAMAACIGLLEAEVAATRVGKNGVAQAEVRGLVAAGFDHWDSRAGDPHLHTHVVVANRVQAADGAWRTLDSRALYRSVVAVSETYHGLLADELTLRLGGAWDQRPRRHSAVAAWEIADVPDELIAAFSQRSQAIEAEKNQLVAVFRDRHGREPSSVEVLRLRQRATLTTRPDKQLHSLAALTEQWWERASNVLGMDAQAWAKGIGAEAVNRWIRATDLTEQQVTALARTVRGTVEAKRSTWSRWNLHAEAARQLMGYRFVTAEDRFAAMTRVIDLAAAECVLLTPPVIAITPAVLRRGDGTSMFAHKHSQRYTSRTLLEAEARLLNASRDSTGPRVPTAALERSVVSPPPGHRYVLGGDQRNAVRMIATSGRVLDVLVGPAGTGKTVTLAGLRTGWESQHGPNSVIGLAPSASAADVLAVELDIETENTAKWIAEADQEPSRLHEIDRCSALLHRIGARNPRLSRVLQQRHDDLVERVDRWRLHPGQLVVIDEASLAGTLTLDRISTQARAAGAKVLLVGDWAQLSAIEAAGAFSMLVRDRVAPAELGAIRRFTAKWEREASRRLRTGDTHVIADYQTHGRIREGDGAAMLDAAYRAWLADEQAGKPSLLLTGDSATVTELNTRARVDLVTAGRVEANGTQLAAGNVAGVGDRVVTRKNNRLLSTSHAFVKNGDQWIVTARERDGAITIQRVSGGPRVTLPPDYVAEHVDLAYATTAYRAQGATVDTAHAVISGPSMTREALYVAMTRGRHNNTAYVATDGVLDDCDEPHLKQNLTGRDVLASVLGNIGADVAAHDVMRAEQDNPASISQLAAEYETIATSAQAPRWSRALTASGLSAEQVSTIEQSPSYGALAAALRLADTAQRPIERHLPDLVAARSLTDAEDAAAVLHDRVTRWANANPSSLGPDGAIAGLIPVACGIDDPDTERALRERAELIEQRSTALVDHGLLDGEPWIQKLGHPPSDTARRAKWTRAAQTVAAYRDRYLDNGDASESQAPTGEDQTAVRQSVHDAIALSRIDAGRATLAPNQALAREPALEL